MLQKLVIIFISLQQNLLLKQNNYEKEISLDACRHPDLRHLDEGGENGCIGMGAQMNSESKCGPIIISNKIKTLEVYNPEASGTNLRTVIFGETIEFGNTKQALNFMLYLLVHLEKEYDEVKQDVHNEIFKDGKRFRITPLK